MSVSTLAADVLALLEAYAPSDAEKSARVAMLELVERGPAAFDRESFEPGHFTASAFVLAPDAEELLLIEHAKLGRWLQPGGHVEVQDATLLDAVRRELREETGIERAIQLQTGIFDIDVHAIPSGGKPEHLHFDVRFLFRAESRELRPASDAKAARWSALGAVSALESDASVMRAVERLRTKPSL